MNPIRDPSHCVIKPVGCMNLNVAETPVVVGQRAAKRPRVRQG